MRTLLLLLTLGCAAPATTTPTPPALDVRADHLAALQARVDAVNAALGDVWQDGTRVTLRTFHPANDSSRAPVLILRQVSR